jgi:hypothetical protein
MLKVSNISTGEGVVGGGGLFVGGGGARGFRAVTSPVSVHFPPKFTSLIPPLPDLPTLTTLYNSLAICSPPLTYHPLSQESSSVPISYPS